MFERFTERARQVVVLAQDEARLLGHGHVGTEHLLLGLLREEEGVAARVLAAFGVTVDEVRAQVARIVGAGTEVVTGQIPFTPSATAALERAWNEALLLGQPFIDTHHVLLGLVRVKEGVAARVLLDFDANASKIRTEVIGMVSGPQHTIAPGEHARLHFIGDEEAPGGPHLILACPECATPIETITSDRRNTAFHVSAQGERTCPGCGNRWTIAYTVSWEKPSPHEAE